MEIGKTLKQRYDELQLLLEQHAIVSTEQKLATTGESAVLAKFQDLRTKVQVAGKAAEDAIPFPDYSQHPDWPTKYETTRNRIEEIESDRETRGQMQFLLDTLRGSRVLRLGGPASQAMGALRNDEPVGAVDELSQLKRSASGYTKKGGKVKLIREQMYGAWQGARKVARNIAIEEIMQSNQELVRAHDDVLMAIHGRRVAINIGTSKEIELQDGISGSVKADSAYTAIVQSYNEVRSDLSSALAVYQEQDADENEPLDS